MRGHALLVDCVVALVLIVVCVGWGLAVRAGMGSIVLSPVLVGPLAVRRTNPELCLVAVSVGAVTQWLTVLDTDGLLAADIALPICVYAAVVYGRVWTGRAALVLMTFTAGVGGVHLPLLPSPVSTHLLVSAFTASTLAAVWLSGALTRVRRRQGQALAERARLLEVERDQRDQLAVLAERTRIAREMHDVVAHSLAGVIAQADGGLYAGTAQAKAAALTAIGDHARRALAETRRVLGVLRHDAGPTDQAKAGPRGDVGTSSRPGVDDLPGLVEQLRGGGLPVDLTLQLPTVVEPGLSLVAYRIVQEGLTNVIKHAGAGTASEVTVRWGARLLEIDVLDNGRGPRESPPAAACGSGYGVLGMRERVSAYGGTVTLLPRPGGGMALRARIPV